MLKRGTRRKPQRFVYTTPERNRAAVSVDASIVIDLRDLSGWSAAQLKALFSGIAKITAATANSEPEPPPPDRYSADAGSVE